jgi:hypothetical protein
MTTKFDPCRGPKLDAKNLLKTVRAEEHEACERARRYRPDMAGATNEEVGKRYTLLMARHTIAKDLGFESWKALEANPPKLEKVSAASSTPVAGPLSGAFAKPNAQLLPNGGTGIPKLESTADKLRSMGAMVEIKARTWEADVLKEGASWLESEAQAAARVALGHTDDLEDLDKVTREIMGHSPEIETMQELERVNEVLLGRTALSEILAAFGTTPEGVRSFVEGANAFANQVAKSDEFRGAIEFLRGLAAVAGDARRRLVEELNARPELLETLKALVEASNRPQVATAVIPRR